MGKKTKTLPIVKKTTRNVLYIVSIITAGGFIALEEGYDILGFIISVFGVAVILFLLSIVAKIGD